MRTTRSLPRTRRASLGRSGLRSMAAAALLGAITLTSSWASAQTNAWPQRHVDRDLALPRHTLRIDGGPRWPLPTGQISHYINRGWDDAVVLRAGASFGVTENLELGFAQPLLIIPDADLQNPIFHGTYQFLRGPVDVGAFWGIVIPYEGHATLRGGVPLYVHVANNVRLDLGGFLRLELPEDNTTLDLEAPFIVPINVTPQVFLGPEVALITWGGFDDVAVPAGFFVGYTVTTGGGVLGDFSFRIRETDLRSDRAFDQIELVFAADLFFDL